ncbi:bifunctional tRNA (5-methylaminomethyl-2-thiouridine)(34)-methyltransferase MnmD/FAD-dependent 5-carboxymethylaminomethyl-2-thiouridine(34) oxidoreductase MnmC [Pleionea sediminis]|uniref:bifunctional tRNA (5-methylaminomethyl-2-thiouridine)(34)-methyltransferase MnmD/FAD-dependent 5-carboxymethylaminomethyl-2-thiouridine(34) oxidoreductase MnmC n=1 Tax=Pleionea sediminis TaxID=2569479 RepID=UPI00118544E3|nr:bifunctional tRNA (5-methylaminomethyl-2-thiouridine)(34)-methyltransferase MnmD/FAD-dependent 5-carboxymethylaminomethyl-2-thiouridine(34) oxidoreductase MnmC [Pleionea sediminis]
MNPALLENASIDWRDGVPFSTVFNDIYFSRQDGLQETLYTFIEGNHLHKRWSSGKKSKFIITELGFGTGLNFLSTLKFWHTQNTSHSHLDYFSVEKFPLTLTDLKQAIDYWPDLNPYAKPLVKHYPLPFKGIWKIEYPQYNATLNLLWMDVVDAFEHWRTNNHQSDAWYLDGFAPAKNQDLWERQLFKEVAQCSANNSTFATFTAAGFVRRGLVEAGFNVTKRKGFGHKREMLIGTLDKINHLSEQPASKHESKPKIKPSAPWFQYQKRQVPKNIAIIGGGIAGCTTARKLADAGFSVHLFEKDNAVALGASGNSAGIYYPFLSKDINLTTQFFLQAYHQLLHDFDYYQLNEYVRKTGVIRLQPTKDDVTGLLKDFKRNPETQRWFTHVSPPQTHQAFEALKDKEGLYFPCSGFVFPQKICEKLIKHKNIKVSCNADIKSLTLLESGWQLLCDATTFIFDSVIVCNSFSANHLLPQNFLPAITVRGQTCKLNRNSLPFNLPEKVICDDIYLIPQDESSLYVGATFEHNNHEEQLLTNSQDLLLEQLEKLTDSQINGQTLSGKVGFRYCSVDRLPFVGPLIQLQSAKSEYNDLWKGKRASNYSTAEHWPGLYVNLAHGARGITSSFLCAEIIKGYISNRSMPTTERLRELVHPSRFLIKELRKPESKRLPGIAKLFQEIQN